VTVNVLALQTDIVWENKLANFDKARRLLDLEKPEAGSLVALPEMFATGFSMNTAAVAESYGGETEQFLAAIAKEFGVTLVAGAAMRQRDGRVRNKALVFSPEGTLIAWYAKMRLFSPGGECEHYVPGDQPAFFPWAGITVSPFICYDLRFPEIFRRIAGERAPELFVVIANFPAKRVQHWLALLRARAVENQAYVMGVNRVGSDPVCSYNGHSVVVDPNGDVIADAGEQEGFTRAELDSAALRKYREALPFLADLRS
jgi:omega-amidase